MDWRPSIDPRRPVVAGPHAKTAAYIFDAARLAGSGAHACLDQEARSALTTINRGSRSTWMFKAKPPGQAVSARRSATIVEYLIKDRDALLTFYGFPAEPPAISGGAGLEQPSRSVTPPL